MALGRKDMHVTRESAIEQLSDVLQRSQNGLPSISQALRGVASAPNTPKVEKDISLFAWSILETLTQLHALITVAATTTDWKSVPDQTLLRDLPGLRSLDGKPPRANLEALILRALEPPTDLLDVVTSLFKKSAPSLPFVPDLRVLATEIVDGWPVGEVRRRANGAHLQEGL